MRVHSFQSAKFLIDPHEDEATNPFCYGKALAEWLRQTFRELGYEPEEVIPEDWGWCVVLKRRPFLLWIGCANERTEMLREVRPEEKERFIPDPKTFRWNCIVQAESPIWTSFFWRRALRLADYGNAVSQVEAELAAVLRAEPGIHDFTFDTGDA